MKVYIKYNSLNERVICVHEKPNMECVICIEEEKNLKGSYYYLTEYEFEVVPSVETIRDNKIDQINEL